jgi:hypothetical protein
MNERKEEGGKSLGSEQDENVMELTEDALEIHGKMGTPSLQVGRRKMCRVYHPGGASSNKFR